MTKLTLALMALTMCACGGQEVPSTCAADEDCLDGYACDLEGTKICLRACTAETEASDCLAGQACVIADGEAAGVCKTAAAPVE